MMRERDVGLDIFSVVVGSRYLQPNFANSIRPRKR